MSETERKKKLLILTPRWPYPVIGGDRIRIFYMCKELSKDFSLTLLSLCEEKEQLTAGIPADGVFDRVERIYFPRWRSVLNALIALPTRTPLQVAYYRSPEFRNRVRELVPGHDASLAHLIRVGDYLRGLEAPCILEMTDAISLNYHRIKAMERSRGIKTRIFALESGRVLNYERKMLREFPLVSIVSGEDRDFLLKDRMKEKNQNILVCSNGTDLSLFPFQPVFTDPVAVFIGNMTTVQNLDACQWFIDRVMPLLRLRLKEFIFRIVGRIPASDLNRLRSIPGVEVTGEVDRVAHAVAGARVGLCPMRMGAGVQNKILEYMALGLPTVTSPIGLEGLAAQPGQDLVVARTPEEYVEQIHRIFSDPRWAASLAISARRYVEQNHEWSAQLLPLRTAISGLIAKKNQTIRLKGNNFDTPP